MSVKWKESADVMLLFDCKWYEARCGVLHADSLVRRWGAVKRLAVDLTGKRPWADCDARLEYK